MARIRTTNRLYFEAIVYALPREKFGGLGSSAPLALESVGPNPTDRGKNGTKRNILVDENGVPLSLVVTGANRHDSVALDAAYVGKGPVAEANGFTPHIRPRRDDGWLSCPIPGSTASGS